VALIALVLAVGAAAWVRRLFLVVTVDGASMRPAFADGERVLVRRTAGDRVRRGQVVLFADGPPGRVAAHRYLIKRVAAVAGDAVPDDFAGVVPPGRVPAGRILVLGDNRPVSVDSRAFGYLPVELLVGRVIRRLADTTRSSADAN
jgi:signal peptidase I